MHSNKPNIILVVVDALRADHLSCYGYHKLTSPNIDKFTEDCVLFQSAFSASPSTVGSIPSILTGVYPSFHGTGVDGNVLALSQTIPTLPEVLNENGYTTVGLNTNPYMVSKHGYSRGYTSYFDLLPIPINKKKKLFNKLKLFQFTNPPYINSHRVIKQAAKWLRKNRKSKPFFMWVHFMDTHAPYFPRQPYFSQFSNNISKENISLFKKQFNQIYTKLFKDSNLITLEERQLLINCYDSEIRYLDQTFRNLLTLLKRYHLFDNTLIILTSDHGEEFWEHGRWGHYTRMYDVNIHVPLLIKYLPLTSKGKVVSKQVQNIDIFPTVLSILNIKPRDYLSGTSLLPLINEGNSAPESVVVSEGGGIQGISVKAYIDRLYSLRTPKWKYIKNVTQTQKQLYHLEKDPKELNNLADDPSLQETIKKLDYQLKDLLNSSTEFKKIKKSAEIDRQIIESLKILGYM